MKIAVYVQDGAYMVNAWCEVPEKLKKLTLREIIDRYVEPTTAHAVSMIKDKKKAKKA